MIGHPPPCPACGDPLSPPGATYACPAILEPTMMRTCNAGPFCRPACGCPTRHLAPDQLNGRRWGGPVHDWAGRG